MAELSGTRIQVIIKGLVAFSPRGINPPPLYPLPFIRPQKRGGKEQQPLENTRTKQLTSLEFNLNRAVSKQSS